MAESLSIHCAGEAALIAYLGESSSPTVAARVAALADAVEDALGEALVDLIPSYASLLVLFDPMVTDHFHVRKTIKRCARGDETRSHEAGRLIEIPVFYHPDAGEDLEAMARLRSMAWEEIATLHSEREYRVYAIGFAPGFAYLGDVDERIAAPRLATPRQRVPRGAVAIADRQTAVYPAPSPGGWNLIGRSPMRMFDAEAQPPMPVRTGDRVRFVPIDRDEFVSAGGEL